MSHSTTTDEIRNILEMDRIWSAYALADLDPNHGHLSRWYVEKETLVMTYHGMRPPVLFAVGHPGRLESLIRLVPAGKYLYTIPTYARVMLRRRSRILKESRMWRMNLNQDHFPGRFSPDLKKLNPSDLDKINILFDDHLDRPDAFTPEQLAQGIFYGAFEGEDLISLSGTHIISLWASVAAIGNVFTRPDRRALGWATKVTSAVVSDLILQGITTIVLNVDRNNQPAIACYQKLGFWPHLGYLEGLAELWPEK